VRDVRIDKVRALAILEEESASAASGDVSDDWIERIRDLERACAGSNLTFFAALGTAMVAKVVDLEVDVFSLKAGASERGYSARSLCKDVVAAHAPRLGIDLGVTGREPLNNQPFYAEERISADLPVRKGAREALTLLLQTITALESIRSEPEARLALRSFLQVRRRDDSRWLPAERGDTVLTLEALSTLVMEFVGLESEFGKRAQAVVAGVLDVAFGEDRVVTSRIHDPDRHFPGDVGVRVLEHELPHAGIVAVAGGQAVEELEPGVAWAAERGLLIATYTSWRQFVRDVLFWSPHHLRDAVRIAHRTIFTRARELEVSEQGLEWWARAESGRD